MLSVENDCAGTERPGSNRFRDQGPDLTVLDFLTLDILGSGSSGVSSWYPSSLIESSRDLRLAGNGR